MWSTEKEESSRLLSNMKGYPPFAFYVGSWVMMKNTALNLQIIVIQVDIMRIGLKPMEISKMVLENPKLSAMEGMKIEIEDLIIDPIW